MRRTGAKQTSVPSSSAHHSFWVSVSAWVGGNHDDAVSTTWAAALPNSSVLPPSGYL